MHRRRMNNNWEVSDGQELNGQRAVLAQEAGAGPVMPLQGDQERVGIRGNQKPQGKDIRDIAREGPAGSECRAKVGHTRVVRHV